MTTPSVLISGLGLMGGSLAASLSSAGWRVFVHHHRPTVAHQAQARGWGHAVSTFTEAPPVDLAVVCTPVSVIAPTVRAIAAATSALITDVGSTKAGICAELSDLGPRFIGSHLMCGSHRQGLGSADPELYRGRVALITPTTLALPADIERIKHLWRAAGSRTVCMTPAMHDRLVAEASHLPHVLASLTASQLTTEAVPLCAGGFRDATRIAAAGPDLWVDILLANRDAMLPLLRNARERLHHLEAALLAGDGPEIRAWLAAGHAGRKRYDDAQSQSQSPLA